MNVGDCGVEYHESGAKWFEKPSRGEFWNAKHSEKRKKKKKQISEQKKRENEQKKQQKKEQRKETAVNRNERLRHDGCAFS